MGEALGFVKYEGMPKGGYADIAHALGIRSQIRINPIDGYLRAQDPHIRTIAERAKASGIELVMGGKDPHLSNGATANNLAAVANQAYVLSGIGPVYGQIVNKGPHGNLSYHP